MNENSAESIFMNNRVDSGLITKYVDECSKQKITVFSIKFAKINYLRCLKWVWFVFSTISTGNTLCNMIIMVELVLSTIILKKLNGVFSTCLFLSGYSRHNLHSSPLPKSHFISINKTALHSPLRLHFSFEGLLT